MVTVCYDWATSAHLNPVNNHPLHVFSVQRKNVSSLRLLPVTASTQLAKSARYQEVTLTTPPTALVSRDENFILIRLIIRLKTAGNNRRFRAGNSRFNVKQPATHRSHRYLPLLLP